MRIIIESMVFFLIITKNFDMKEKKEKEEEMKYKTKEQNASYSGLLVGRLDNRGLKRFHGILHAHTILCIYIYVEREI